MTFRVASGGGGSGTVQQVNTGTGLFGGPIVNAGTISITATGVVSATYGSVTTVPVIAVNDQGQIISAVNVALSAGSGTVTNIETGAGLFGGPIVGAGTISITATGVTLGTYGNATNAPVLAVNAQGQITSAFTVAISAGQGTVTNVATGTGLFGGPFTGAGTLSITATGVSSGTYGSVTTVPVITINAQGQITTAVDTAISASGGATLDGITAATADQAGIANADWNVRWNWAKVTDAEDAFTFGESAAATGGTSTSGVPNQVLLKLATVAASTMSPLSVYSRTLHVFSVSPTSRQIFAGNGTAAEPIYSFASDPDNGLYRVGADNIGLSAGGSLRIEIGTTTTINTRLYLPIGTATSSSLTDVNNANTGWYWPATNTMGIANGTDGEWVRFLATTFQVNKGSADAVSYAINARKARGTVASPTVITTGDDLLTISGYGYVGATGTYVQAATIRFDSTGTIANTTSGTGGIIRFEAAAVGAVAPAEILRLTRGTTTGGGWATMNEADASPAAGDLADGDEVAFYIKAGNAVFAQNVGGAMKFLFIPIDGSTTLWTADGTGP